MSFICIIIKTHVHNKGFALSLGLKVKLFGTRKWPIGNIEYFYFPYRRWDRYVTWVSEPREGLAVYRAKRIPFLLVNSRPRVLVRPWESNPRHPVSSSRLPRPLFSSHLARSKYNIPRCVNRKPNKRVSNVIFLVL